MALTLVPSDDTAPLAIRDHILPLVRERGTVERQHDVVRVTTLHMEGWSFEHWTPFNALSSGEASSPGYRHALERQHTRPDLPYGLRVQREGRTVLTLLWADNGTVKVVAFVRGAWEQEALTL
jgi:hypothetical protein